MVLRHVASLERPQDGFLAVEGHELLDACGIHTEVPRNLVPRPSRLRLQVREGGGPLTWRQVLSDNVLDEREDRAGPVGSGRADMANYGGDALEVRRIEVRCCRLRRQQLERSPPTFAGDEDECLVILVGLLEDDWLLQAMQR